MTKNRETWKKNGAVQDLSGEAGYVVCAGMSPRLHEPDELMSYPNPVDDPVKALLVAAYNAMVYTHRVEDLCARLGVRHGLGIRTTDKLLDVSCRAAKLIPPPTPPDLPATAAKEVAA